MSRRAPTDNPLRPILKHVEKRGDVTLHYETTPPRGEFSSRNCQGISLAGQFMTQTVDNTVYKYAKINPTSGCIVGPIHTDVSEQLEANAS
jgi:hypothetical protein